MTLPWVTQMGIVEIHRQFRRFDPDDVKRLRSSLSADELLRGDRLIVEAKKNRFLAGRGFLRETLSGYLGVPPREVQLGAGAYGKPFLNDTSYPPIRFNISHAGEFAIIALTLQAEVGIDVELMDRDLSFPEIARRYFSTSEQSALFGLAVDERLDAFYRCWTRKEAYLKGIGAGFSRQSTSFDVTLVPGAPAEILSDRLFPEEANAWSLCDIDVPEGYLAALSHSGKAPKIRYHSESSPP